jgi:hypothetical protein
MIEHLEKELKRYVIATFDNPTNYVVCNGNCNYSFIDNIQLATKFASKYSADEIFRSIKSKYQIDIVVLPLSIKYILLEDE